MVAVIFFMLLEKCHYYYMLYVVLLLLPRNSYSNTELSTSTRSTQEFVLLTCFDFDFDQEKVVSEM